MQLAEQILNIHPHQPIILCTGFSELVSEEKARALGISILALKPITMHQMSLFIREALTEEAPLSPS
jgi:DNA-binding NtrC family response regulator